MKKGPDPKMFLILAVAGLALGGASTFFAFSGLKSANADLKDLQANSKAPKTLESDLDISKAMLQDGAAKLQHLEMGVQEYAYVPTMLTELEKLGKSSGIDVLGVRPVPKPVVAKDEKPTRKAYDELDIEVKGRGTYRSVMNFVKSLSSFPKIVAARTVELTPKNDPGQTSNLLDVTVNLRAYIFPAPANAQPAKDGGSPPPQSPTSPKTAMKTGGTHEG